MFPGHLIGPLFFILSVLLPSSSHLQGSLDSPTSSVDSVATFQSDIAPLLKSNCTPCHFPGGKMYQEYPFDDYSTVHRLRKRLHTRLEKPEQKAILTRWIDSGAKEK